MSLMLHSMQFYVQPVILGETCVSFDAEKSGLIVLGLGKQRELTNLDKGPPCGPFTAACR